MAFGLSLLGAACGRSVSGADDVRLDWRIDPSPPAVGPARMDLELTRPDGRPLAGARLRLEGHMTHPGMAPVLAPVEEQSPGAYRAQFSFTMSGDWVLVLRGETDEGQPIRRQLDVLGVEQAR